MQFTAEIIESFLEGEFVGDKNATVSTLAKIEEGATGALSFLSNLKYEPYIYTTKSSIVIVGKDFVPQSNISATLVKVADPYASFAQLLDLYIANKPAKTGVSSLAFTNTKSSLPEDLYLGEFAVIGESVKIGSGVKIYPHVVIGDNVSIGNNVTLYPTVVIYEGCVLGNNVTIHSGSIIGADGFGFAPIGEEYKKIPQIGNVVIEDNVEIGANTCIDRATMGSTTIKKGVKLDNLIQIGHNVVIGENSVAAAQVGVAGSSKVGKNCMFGGQVGISGHIEIADKSMVSSQTGVPNSLKKEGGVWMGTPATEASDCRRVYAVQKSLPAMSRKLYELEKEVNRLKSIIEK
ncbi:MAG: UDP-3-O-(3-hydroxymyristoyl)glucosamine N-acyltransferase [Rikenellaceae bacterium]